MFNLSKKLLDIKDGERIYVTCETKNGIPDPFQIICGCTLGNNGLDINHGKMAVTVNKKEPQERLLKVSELLLILKKQLIILCSIQGI
jgi:formylmethanofuran dehydrogenase subunit E